MNIKKRNIAYTAVFILMAFLFQLIPIPIFAQSVTVDNGVHYTKGKSLEFTSFAAKRFDISPGDVVVENFQFTTDSKGDVDYYVKPYSLTDDGGYWKHIAVSIEDLNGKTLFSGDLSSAQKMKVATINNSHSSGMVMKFKVPNNMKAKDGSFSQGVDFTVVDDGKEIETDPTEPTGPSVPTEPTLPTQPTGPTQPTNPTLPTSPVAPTMPHEPTDSTDSIEPADPSDPDNATDITETGEVNNTKKDGNAVQTGDTFGFTSIIVLVASLVIVIGVLITRKRGEK